MSAASTTIQDVSAVRPSASAPGSEPATAPVIDFAMIVALLQGAARPAPSAAAAVPAATATGEPVATAAAPPEAPASAGAPSTPLPVTLPAAGLPASMTPTAASAPVVPAIACPASGATTVTLAESELRPLIESRVGNEIAVETGEPPTAPRKRQGERVAVPAAGERTSDEPTMPTDAPVVAVVPALPVVMPGLLPAVPLPANVAAASSSAPPARDPAPASSPASPVESTGASPAPVAPSRPGFASVPQAVSSPPVAGDGLAPSSAATTPAFAPAASPAASMPLATATSIASSPGVAASAPSPATVVAAPGTHALGDATATVRAPAAADTSHEGASEQIGADSVAQSDQPRTDAGPIVRPRAPWSAGTEDGRARNPGEPATSVANGAFVRVAAGRPPVASSAATADSADPPSSVPSSPSTVEHAEGVSAPRAVTVAREPASAMPADATPSRSITIADGAPSSGAGLAASRDASQIVRRVRAESGRDDGGPDGLSPRASERGAHDATISADAGGVSFETWASPTRAMAADEPPRAQPMRAPVVEQVVSRLKDLRSDGRHEISMRLDPPDLGGVTIDARLEGARLTVHIRAEHGATQELLNNALPRLRESLAQQGFVPDQVSVQLGLDGGRGGAARRDGGHPFTAPSPVSPPPAPARASRVPVAASAPGARAGLDVWA